LSHVGSSLCIFHDSPGSWENPSPIRSGAFIVVDANKGFSAFKKCRRVERVRRPRCQEQRSDTGYESATNQNIHCYAILALRTPSPHPLARAYSVSGCVPLLSEYSPRCVCIAPRSTQAFGLLAEWPICISFH